MLIQSTSRFVAAAAVVAIAGSIPLLAIKDASGQTVGRPGDHPNCAHIADAGENAQCHYEQAIRDSKARTETARQRAEAYRQEAEAARRATAKSEANTVKSQEAIARSEVSIAKSEANIAKSEADIRCTDALKEARKSGVYDPEVARSILRAANKSLLDYGTCNLARALCARMTRPDPNLCRPA
jgi:hypothetical protein